jgi:putative transposase
MDVKERYTKGAHATLDLVLCGDIALQLRDLIKEICALQGMTVIKGNIRSNHVHVLVKAPSHLSPARKAAQHMRC